MRALRLPALIFAAGLLFWIINAAIVWLSAAPLGHDEAQYALSAHDLLVGDEPRWFYVSSGMSVVAAIGETLGHGEVALRFPAFVLGIGFVLAAAGLAWRVYGAMTAAWVVVVLAGLRSIAGMSSDLLTDLPSTALLLAGSLVMIGEVLGEEEDAAPRWRVVFAAPLLAAALYVRYASCIPIALIGVGTLVVGLPQIRRRPLPIVVTAAAFVLLLVPHLVQANHETGSPLGILLASKDVPGRTWFAQGLATYTTSNPVRYYGLLAPPILLAGLAAITRVRHRPTMLLWLIAVSDIVVLGLISHAQPRYIFFGVTLLVILGVEQIRRWVGPRRWGAVVAAVAVLASCLLMLRTQVMRSERKRETASAAYTAASVIRTDAHGRRCYVIGDAFAQLEWYSGCRGSSWPWDEREETEPVYVVHTPSTLPVPTRGDPHVLLARPAVTVTRFDVPDRATIQVAPVDECIAGCDAARRTCNNASITCVADCKASAALRACVTPPYKSCMDMSMCGLRAMCGETVASGTGTCLSTATCQAQRCSPSNAVRCGCECALTMSRVHAQALTALDACAVDCKFDEPCIRGKCAIQVTACASQ